MKITQKQYRDKLWNLMIEKRMVPQDASRKDYVIIKGEAYYPLECGWEWKPYWYAIDRLSYNRISANYDKGCVGRDDAMQDEKAFGMFEDELITKNEIRDWKLKKILGV